MLFTEEKTKSQKFRFFIHLTNIKCLIFERTGTAIKPCLNKIRYNHPGALAAVLVGVIERLFHGRQVIAPILLFVQIGFRVFEFHNSPHIVRTLLF